jgi:tellurite resistance protein TehA-like permease
MEIEDYKRAYREVAKQEERHGFVAHLVSYILLNTLMFLCNIFLTKGVLWFYFPLIFWGIGLLSHYLWGIRWLENELTKREHLAEEFAKRGVYKEGSP